MTKLQQQIEHVVVTAVEAAIAYIVAVPHVTVNKTVLAGAAGAALSAVYNVLRQSTPTIAPDASLTAAVPNPPAGPGAMNGVPQLTQTVPGPSDTNNTANTETSPETPPPTV